MEETTLFVNDLRKGTKIRLRDGSEGVLLDSRRTFTRLVDVAGPLGPTLGDVHAAEIAEAFIEGAWVPVQANTRQKASLALGRAVMDAMTGKGPR